jgi:hypothetical protein
MKSEKTHEAEKEGSSAAIKSEQQQSDRGTGNSYSESNDVTPPEHKDFPVVGPGKTDFEARPNGRTTGRMVGHEPGTESL